MKGQLSLEFLIVLAVYTVFIYLLISSLDSSKFLKNANQQDFLARVNTLKLLETERLINNKFTDMPLSMEGCLISQKTIICKKENMSKIDNVSIRSDSYLLMFYKPLS